MVVTMFMPAAMSTVVSVLAIDIVVSMSVSGSVAGFGRFESEFALFRAAVFVP